MSLTRKQKRQIEKIAKSKNVNEICLSVKAPFFEVNQYLKYLGITNTKEEKTKPFNFKIWIKENYIFFIIISVLIFSVYANALKNSFLSDDIGIIAQDPNLKNIGLAFSKISLFVRPLMLSIIDNLFGKNPIFFRLPNIFFHIGNTILLFFLIEKSVNRKVAIFSTAVYSVHPLLIESITWISGGYYPLYSFFLMLSLLFYSIKEDNKKFIYISLLSYLVAMFSAERSVIFPPILLFWEICFGNIRKNWKKTIPFFALSFVWSIIFLIDQINFRVSSLQSQYYQKKTIANPFVQTPISISSYFELLLWPEKLTLYHSEMNFGKLNFSIRALSTLTYFIGMIFSYFKNKKVFFWLSFFFINLIPSLTPLGISWVVAERYTYLAIMGIIVVIGIGIEKFILKSKPYYWLYLLTVILVIPLSIRTVTRNIDWKNQDNLWLAADKYSPNSHQNHNNLGDLWARRGNFEKAVEEFQQAINILPNYADAYHNMGTSYFQLKKTNEAIKSYEAAIYYNSNLWQSHQNLGAIYFSQNNFEKAREHFLAASEINPNNPSLLSAVGIIDLKIGNKNEAKQYFEKVLLIDPKNQEALAGYQEASK